ncbi:MAG: hypothetical protein ACD_33C00036G0010 [uncultured bacterium]|nr:MAG: hypothetical protein ACD_33C00036G0010 [uncultured bacterium]
MHLISVSNKNKGLCFVCGKSTKLNIHSTCGKKSKTKPGNVKQTQSSPCRDNPTKKKYVDGKVPSFCFK